MQPVLGLLPVMNYLSKYVTKEEVFSKTYKESILQLSNGLEDEISAKYIVQRLMVSSVAERDISAQETHHLLCGLPLRKASRVWKTINAYPDQKSFTTLQPQTSDDETLLKPTFWEEYKQRPAELDDVCAIEFARDYKSDGGVYIRRIRKRPIIQVIPLFVTRPTKEDREELFCSSELRLYKPFREENDLIGDHESVSEAFLAFEASGYNRWHISAKLSHFEELRKAQPNASLANEPEMLSLDAHLSVDTLEKEEMLEWQALNKAVETVDDQLIFEHMLGRRDLDLQETWEQPHQDELSCQELLKWIPQAQSAHPGDLRTSTAVAANALGPKQRLVLDMVSDPYTADRPFPDIKYSSSTHCKPVNHSNSLSKAPQGLESPS